MKNGRIARNTALIVASAVGWSTLAIRAAEPPPGLLRKIALRETENAQARENYTYRQSISIQEFNDTGQITGEYHEVIDIIYSPSHARYARVVGIPSSTLTHVKLTAEDYNDLKNIQPFLLTRDEVSLYEGKYRGEESVDGVPCFVESIGPKQILSTQRFFQGTIWVRESDFAVLKSEGQAVPQIETLKNQNLFPHFTTFRKEVDGKWLFPVVTFADDTLFFRSWPQRLRIEIRYMSYQKFEATSTVTFGDPAPTPDQPAPLPPPAK
jgi:hypothetical protein